MSEVEIVQGMILDGFLIQADNEQEFEAMKRFVSDVMAGEQHANNQ